MHIVLAGQGEIYPQMSSESVRVEEDRLGCELLGSGLGQSVWSPCQAGWVGGVLDSQSAAVRSSCHTPFLLLQGDGWVYFNPLWKTH